MNIGGDGNWLVMSLDLVGNVTAKFQPQDSPLPLPPSTTQSIDFLRTRLDAYYCLSLNSKRSLLAYLDNIVRQDLPDPFSGTKPMR
jgi:hypothetical protein